MAWRWCPRRRWPILASRQAAAYQRDLLGGVAALGGIVAGVSGGGDSGGDAAPVNTPPSFTSGHRPASPKASPLPIRRWPPMRRTTRWPTAFRAPMRRCSTLTHRLARLRSRPRPISKTPPTPVATMSTTSSSLRMMARLRPTRMSRSRSPIATIIARYSPAASASVVENQTAAYTAAATDADAGTALTYSLSGTDAALFNIDAATGVVTFKAAPNFEAPGDAGGNNVYDVIVTASDGTNSTTARLLSRLPMPTKCPRVHQRRERQRSGEPDRRFHRRGDRRRWRYADLQPFGRGRRAVQYRRGDRRGNLQGCARLEVPADAGANNVYDVVVTANDGINNTTSRWPSPSPTETITSPVFTSSANASATENNTAYQL